jgi:cyclophilin family peptidyl-prolyl cis-trans isomerase
MNRLLNLIIIPVVLLALIGCGSSGSNQKTIVLIKTSVGDIKVRLYDETPVHRANFLKLVSMNFYDGVSFHRVIKEFMIQAGDGNTRVPKMKSPGDTLNTYSIPAEFNAAPYHKKGALAAARENDDINPQLRSSGTQFYIVQGKTYSSEDLDIIESKINNNIKRSMFSRFLREVEDSSRTAGIKMSEAEIQQEASLRLFYYSEKKGDYKLTPEQRKTYMESGGTPRLDQAYTVFGEVVEGLEVVDRIAAEKTDENDKPLNEIKILRMKILKK